MGSGSLAISGKQSADATQLAALAAVFGSSSRSSMGRVSGV